MESRSILLVLCLLAATGAAAQEAYRWVDDDGVVHYSDTPVEGAERILLPAPNVAATRQPTRQSTPATSGAQQDEDAAEGPFRYDSIEIVSPGAEETLWNIEGVLNVSVALQPGLQPGLASDCPVFRRPGFQNHDLAVLGQRLARIRVVVTGPVVGWIEPVVSAVPERGLA